MTINQEQEAHDVRLLNVTKQYGRHRAVDGISISINRGEFVSLLGPSGCGKTTTLRMLAGFVGPSSGEIQIAGQDMSGVAPHRRPVNMVFQSYALFPHMTVAGNVAYGPRRKRMPRSATSKAVDEALDLVGLSHLRDRHPRELSGGQQQRVALARALVNRPNVLLLDEPLGALDLKLRRQMQIELKKLHEQVGITFVYVTHDQEEALVMSDRIAVMTDGRIEQFDDPYTVYERPASSFVADFIGQTNLLTCRVEATTGEIATVRHNDISVKIVVDTPSSVATGDEVRIAVRPERISILSGDQTMDNTFPALVQRKVYLGTITNFHVTIGTDISLVVSTSDHRIARQLDRNSRMPIGWHAGDESILQG